MLVFNKSTLDGQSVFEEETDQSLFFVSVKILYVVVAALAVSLLA